MVFRTKVHNAGEWLDGTLAAVKTQTYPNFEICVYNDCSNDSSGEILTKWQTHFQQDLAKRFSITTILEARGHDLHPSAFAERGLGAAMARNQAIWNSHGDILCILDADDVMMPQRLELQVRELEQYPHAIVGCRVYREPKTSTPRYIEWCNTMTQQELKHQRYRDCTVIQPTWMLTRQTFDRCGPYPYMELAEDLHLMYRHLQCGGTLRRVDETLLMYRYHSNSLTFSVPRALLREVRVRWLEHQVLNPLAKNFDPRWKSFTIWNAGRDGKAFFKCLLPSIKQRVRAFCDIDPNKIGNRFFERTARKQDRLYVPVVHWQTAQPPFVLCVALQRTEFEKILASRNLKEGTDYIHFV
jgi:glycosyltransferase involved in cell wall biosynthesis